jgi:hypothetical protein
MRWLVLAVAAMALCACSKADTLYRGVHDTGVGYDVRPVEPPLPGAYDCAVSYDAAHSPDRAQLTRNLLYRCLTRMKADGWEYVLIAEAKNTTLTRKTTQYGATISSQSFPGLRVVLRGYKSADQQRNPQAVPIDPYMSRLKPGVTDAV